MKLFIDAFIETVLSYDCVHFCFKIFHLGNELWCRVIAKQCLATVWMLNIILLQTRMLICNWAMSLSLSRKVYFQDLKTPYDILNDLDRTIGQLHVLLDILIFTDLLLELYLLQMNQASILSCYF